jgi:hypothetical protein
LFNYITDEIRNRTTKIEYHNDEVVETAELMNGRTQAKPAFIVVHDDGYFRTEIKKKRKE